MRERFTSQGAALLLLSLLACSTTPRADQAIVSATPSGAVASFTILETSDLHANIRSYDYFKLAEDKSYGLERTATLIREVRAAHPNSMLLDCGDTIQGTALADYQAQVSPVKPDQNLAIYKAMNTLGYEGGTLGNHEFNYGLSYLGLVTGQHFNVAVTAGEADPLTQKVCSGPNFPLICANVVSVKTGQPLIQPYTITTKYIQATAPDGSSLTACVKVGLIGFCPPPITSWDRRWLEGKVRATGVKEAAEKYIPEMRAKGAEVIVALSHGGLQNAPYTSEMENANLYLAQVPGIDAVLMGHSHQVFPGSFYKAIPDVDSVKGTIHGVPAVMPGNWGNQLGLIHLSLVHDGKAWHADATKATVEVKALLLDATATPKVYAAADPSIAPLVESEHQATITYVKTPIGSSNFALNTLFAEAGEVSAIQVVNMAQADYVSKYITSNLPEYKDLPVLSVSAPFKSGFGGGADYTDVASGPIAINNAADLYLYPNTLNAVKVTGAEIKTWLEKSANHFNQLDPKLTTPQELINTKVPGYNFDMFTSKDLTYEIDVTQSQGSRIRNLSYLGSALSETQSFIVATNNYRAGGGGGFVDPARIILASPDTNRDVLITYIKNQQTLTRAKHGSDRSWRFTKVPGVVGLLHSSASRLSTATNAGLTQVLLKDVDDGSGKGLSTYTINLGQ